MLAVREGIFGGKFGDYRTAADLLLLPNYICLQIFGKYFENICGNIWFTVGDYETAVGGFLTFAKLYLFAQSSWLRAHVKQQCSTLGWLWCDNCYDVIVTMTNNNDDHVIIIIFRCQTTMEAQRTLTATLAKSMRLEEGSARWESSWIHLTT